MIIIVCKFDYFLLYRQHTIVSKYLECKMAESNMGFVKLTVQCYADIFVVNQSLVLLINICGKNLHLRQVRKCKV